MQHKQKKVKKTNMNIEALTDLRIIKNDINDLLTAINDGLTITKSDIELIHKLYALNLEVKHDVLYGGILPF